MNELGLKCLFFSRYVNWSNKRHHLSLHAYSPNTPITRLRKTLRNHLLATQSVSWWKYPLELLPCDCTLPVWEQLLLSSMAHSAAGTAA